MNKTKKSDCQIDGEAKFSNLYNRVPEGDWQHLESEKSRKYR